MERDQQNKQVIDFIVCVVMGLAISLLLIDWVVGSDVLIEWVAEWVSTQEAAEVKMIYQQTSY